MGRNADFLAAKLGVAGVVVGQIRIEPGYHLTHVDDAGRADLKVYTDPHEAIVLARYDDEGRYRPLKTAPNLAHGWRFALSTVEEVLRTLDFLYPAAVGNAREEQECNLRPVPLRETLERQTGMYAVTKKITDDQAATLIAGFCHPGCLRKIRWPISESLPTPAGEDCVASPLPLLCVEACNLLVAEARKVVKGKASS